MLDDRLGVIIEHQVEGGRWREVWRGDRADWVAGDAALPLAPPDRDRITHLQPGQHHAFHLAAADWRVTAIVPAGLADMPPARPVSLTLHFLVAGAEARCGVRLVAHPHEAGLVVVGLLEMPYPPGLATPGVTETVVAALCRQYRLHPSDTLFLRCLLQPPQNEELLFTWTRQAGDWQALPPTRCRVRPAAEVYELLGVWAHDTADSSPAPGTNP